MRLTNIKKKTTHTNPRFEKEKLKLRMAQARVAIMEAIYPSTTYMPFILQCEPHINTEKVTRAMNLRLIDEQIIAKLESVAEKLKAA